MKQRAMGDGIPSCPFCGCRDFRVVRTWYTTTGEKHRAYKCRHCGQHEFNAKTSETITII